MEVLQTQSALLVCVPLATVELIVQSLAVLPIHVVQMDLVLTVQHVQQATLWSILNVVSIILQLYVIYGTEQ